MALEAEIIDALVLAGLIKVDVHDSASAFNTADCESLAVFESCHGTCVVLQGRFNYCLRGEMLLGDECQVPYVNPFLRVACGQNRIAASQILNWFTNPCLANLLNLFALNLEELDHAVPATSDQE